MELGGSASAVTGFSVAQVGLEHDGTPHLRFRGFPVHRFPRILRRDAGCDRENEQGSYCACLGKPHYFTSTVIFICG